MRAVYSPPSLGDFDRLFSIYSTGGGLKNIRVYQPQYRSRGGSVFGLIRSLAKTAFPILKHLVLPEIGNFTQKVTSDIANNVSARDSLKRNLKQSARNLGKRIIRGGGGRRKKNVKRKITQKKTWKSKGKKS